ncbi:hypothetical protein AVEN_251672-1 [Araneus ventricosus]|uniref:Uncharacterized protein n=1 Tax=Araneus ventricosus TaxID=182803 RepID=A0A4Y2HFH2_ARAVE|nr:hypothetical protein AVEN_251672-1 [Araneus ventricosus]
MLSGRGGLVVGTRPWGRRVQNPIPLQIRRVWSQLHAKTCVVDKRPPVGVAWKFGEGVRAHVSSSSSDSSSRGSSQNSPHISSKRDVNITKLNLICFHFIYI